MQSGPSFFTPLKTALAVCLVLALATDRLDTPAFADFGDPCAKYKKGSKKWKKCKKYKFRPGDVQNSEERFMAGYWLAKNQQYTAALKMLRKINTGDDARVLNYIGFATRKLGRVADALVYYQQAIAIDPNYVVARSYLGEAFVSLGNKAAAKAQLREIAVRCGTSCQPYASLKAVLDRSS
ncbi:MAG: tetratricopeptide repeat protein [Alphaproteobacteria bacterium]|nr:tetratricopeptide repeat protein [Alphaproteobacteria bacterium]